MTGSRADTGAAGENLAARYLENLGYEILHRNIRLSRFEIDIVCRDEGTIVFVEVKRSRTKTYGHPATWIDSRKQHRLRQAAEIYIDRFGCSAGDIRFDVITIDKGALEHYRGAF